MKSLLLVFYFLLSIHVFAQTSEKYNSEYANFYRAEELYQKEQYSAAQKEFRIFIDEFKQTNDPLYIKARYYEAAAALELFNNNAVSLMEHFLVQYPESIYKHIIYFKLGRFYYQKKDYPNALAWFNKTGVKDLDAADKDEYLFKLGYANFEEKNYPNARNAFHDIKDGSSQYASPALYYYSHIAYMDGSLQVAYDGFKKLESDIRFSSVVPYYITQINFLQNDYQSVIDYAPAYLDSVSPAYLTDMTHILGYSYYKLNKFDEAIPYFEAYHQKAKTTRQDDYDLGFSYYKAKSFSKAIKSLDKATREKDSLSQYAFYHIGESAMQLNELSVARSAFKAASEIDKNKKIQEDALYQFAVLSYKLDINPYDEAVVALEDFLNKYPDSPRKEDVYQYLVNVYSSTNNHQKALQSLDKIPNKDTKLKTTYQLIAYNYGVDLHQKGKLQEAVSAFELVEKYPVDASMLAYAKYWKGDSYFLLNKMDLSIKAYKEMTGLPGTNLVALKNDAYYNIAYAYLKKNDMSQALDAFTIFIKSNPKNKQKLSDAYLRSGDCQYVLLQNDAAIKNYQEVIKLDLAYQDQALFYMAKAYGYNNKHEQKISSLLNLINNYSHSKFMMTSLSELASTFKSIKDFDKALKYYQQIVNDYPSTVLSIESQIEIADIYYKKSNYSLAESTYKSILSQHGEDRSICERCAQGLIDTYKALKQSEKAIQVSEEYACVSISNDDQEDLFYTPAIDAYVDSLYAVAIDNFAKYLQKFPNGKYAPEARIYKANCHYNTKDYPQAMSLYREALDGKDNVFTEFAAGRVAQYLYNNKEYDQALIYYARLEKTGSKPTTLFNAKLGLMRCHFLIENWVNASNYAKEILASSQISTNIRVEAEYAKGMSNFNTKNYTDAKSSLEWLVKNTTTVMMAEAKYALCEIYFEQKDYVVADKQIKELIKMKPAYNYWIAKALILQSKIQMIQDDLFQAEQTLKSVIDNYPIKDDGILDDANELWNELMQLKNKTKEVPNEETPEIDINENNGGN